MGTFVNSQSSASTFQRDRLGRGGPSLSVVACKNPLCPPSFSFFGVQPSRRQQRLHSSCSGPHASQQRQQQQQQQQRILVRTCNGLELRDPPYMPAANRNGRSVRQPHPQHPLLRGGGGGFEDSPLLDTEDFPPPFSELPPVRPRSSLSHHSHHSHHSFRSMRSFQDELREQ